MKASKRTKEDLYALMRKAISYLKEHAERNPDSEEMAKILGISASRFDHAFKEWVGISPKRFLAYLSKERAKGILLDSKDILKASFRGGLSGAGRLHDLLVSYEAVSPGELKHGAISITYGVHPSPFGWCLIGITKRGICKISFLEKNDEDEATSSLKETWPEAVLSRDDSKTKKYRDRIFKKVKNGKPFRLFLKGTNFQIKVWEAILSIPEGKAASYASIAKALGSPRGTRAVGTACGKNPIGYLIPCHRVLTSEGGLGGYRWGKERKEALLAFEAART